MYFGRMYVMNYGRSTCAITWAHVLWPCCMFYGHGTCVMTVIHVQRPQYMLRPWQVYYAEDKCPMLILKCFIVQTTCADFIWSRRRRTTRSLDLSVGLSVAPPISRLVFELLGTKWKNANRGKVRSLPTLEACWVAKRNKIWMCIIVSSNSDWHQAHSN